jgi:hypothetical protein
MGCLLIEADLMLIDLHPWSLPMLAPDELRGLHLREDRFRLWTHDVYLPVSVML